MAEEKEEEEEEEEDGGDDNGGCMMVRYMVKRQCDLDDDWLAGVCGGKITITIGAKTIKK